MLCQSVCMCAVIYYIKYPKMKKKLRTITYLHPKVLICVVGPYFSKTVLKKVLKCADLFLISIHLVSPRSAVHQWGRQNYCKLCISDKCWVWARNLDPSNLRSLVISNQSKFNITNIVTFACWNRWVFPRGLLKEILSFTLPFFSLI